MRFFSSPHFLSSAMCIALLPSCCMWPHVLLPESCGDLGKHHRPSFVFIWSFAVVIIPWSACISQLFFVAWYLRSWFRKYNLHILFTFVFFKTGIGKSCLTSQQNLRRPRQLCNGNEKRRSSSSLPGEMRSKYATYKHHPFITFCSSYCSLFVV